ncbi:4806_t:CDS:2 [Paraglomus brasilianum]|uniref:tyrosinase n=1 Tax=Paraglomus brasilianum TaxID=144538 RepID=A0A9N9BBF1_9GLOM|nr:4806_t:CDS:2 [Paraglomus brasilianum]
MTDDVILIPPFENVESRLPIEALMSEEIYKIQRDLFLQGFAKVQQKKSDKIESFYKVAGIHHDYCEHNTILFPTWHRAYVSYLEMLIYNEAKTIVEGYPDGDKKQPYIDGLKKVRFPYWDWASPSVLCQGIPSILFQVHVYVNILKESDGEVVKSTERIRNPLRAYTLPENLGILGLVGDTSNPTQRPYIPDASHYPYTPVGYATVRHPNEEYLSNVNSISLDIITSCSSTFRPSIWHLISAVDKWANFSNNGSRRSPEGEYKEYSSIEGVHNAVHNKIGGTGGHMAYVETAGFDPIFFLHHANVDRLTAIWQACYPNSWIVEEDNRDENTSLRPFKNSERGYWTSRDIRDTKDKLKYTYPELEKPNPHLKEDMLIYYQPVPKSNFIYKITISVKKNYVGSSFEIRAFIDLPTKSPTSVTSPYFAGFISIFARDRTTHCDNCDDTPEMVVNDSIDITACMQRLHLINKDNKRIGKPYLTKKSENDLHRRITLIPVLIDGSEISHEDAGLKSARCWELNIQDEHNPPSYKKLEKTAAGVEVITDTGLDEYLYAVPYEGKPNRSLLYLGLAATMSELPSSQSSDSTSECLQFSQVAEEVIEEVRRDIHTTLPLNKLWHIRARFIREGNTLSVAEYSRVAAESWRNLYEVAKMQHAIKYPNYKYQPVRGKQAKKGRGIMGCYDSRLD